MDQSDGNGDRVNIVPHCDAGESRYGVTAPQWGRGRGVTLSPPASSPAARERLLEHAPARLLARARNVNLVRPPVGRDFNDRLGQAA